MRFNEPILHVDMDAFYVEVERLRRPDLIGRPVIVGGAGRRSVVASASYEARRFGVRSAMPSLEARRRCPDIVIVPPDHAEYARVSERVFAILRSFTPLVQALSVDEAFLDVSGLRLHHPSPPAVADAIRAGIRTELALPASVGVAATPFVSKLASRRAKPDGIFHVAADETITFLAALPIGAMWGVGAATEATLSGLGIETIGDLQETPSAVLRRALGASMATHLADLARGIDTRSVVPDGATRSVSVETTFDTDVIGVGQVREVLRRQSEAVARRLRRAGLVARTVTVKLRTPEFETTTRSATSNDPTDLGLDVFALASSLVDGEVHDGTRLRLVGIGLTHLTPADAPRQLTIGEGDRRRQVARAVDEVRDRFGSESVVAASRNRTPRSRQERTKSNLTDTDPNVY